MDNKQKWIKTDNGWRKVKTKMQRFIINPYSRTIFYTDDGKKYNGIAHPNGCMLGYEFIPPQSH